MTPRPSPSPNCALCDLRAPGDTFLAFIVRRCVNGNVCVWFGCRRNTLPYLYLASYVPISVIYLFIYGAACFNSPPEAG